MRESIEDVAVFVVLSSSAGFTHLKSEEEDDSKYSFTFLFFATNYNLLITNDLNAYMKINILNSCKYSRGDIKSNGSSARLKCSHEHDHKVSHQTRSAVCVLK